MLFAVGPNLEVYGSLRAGGARKKAITIVIVNPLKSRNQQSSTVTHISCPGSPMPNRPTTHERPSAPNCKKRPTMRALLLQAEDDWGAEIRSKHNRAPRYTANHIARHLGWRVTQLLGSVSRQVLTSLASPCVSAWPPSWTAAYTINVRTAPHKTAARESGRNSKRPRRPPRVHTGRRRSGRVVLPGLLGPIISSLFV